MKEVQYFIEDFAMTGNFLSSSSDLCCKAREEKLSTKEIVTEIVIKNCFRKRKSDSLYGKLWMTAKKNFKDPLNFYSIYFLMKIWEFVARKNEYIHTTASDFSREWVPLLSLFIRFKLDLNYFIWLKFLSYVECILENNVVLKNIGWEYSIWLGW